MHQFSSITAQGIVQNTNNIQPKIAISRTFNSILPAGSTAVRPGGSVMTKMVPAGQMTQYMQQSPQVFTSFSLTIKVP